MKFAPGSNVVLCNQDRKILAKAIFIGEKDTTFSKVVVQNDQEVELPMTCGPRMYLTSEVNKKLILWKTEQIKDASAPSTCIQKKNNIVAPVNTSTGGKHVLLQANVKKPTETTRPVAYYKYG